MKKLLLIDTLNLLFRSYYAMKNMKTKDNRPTGMIYGLCNYLEKIRHFDYDYVVFALDPSGGSFRKDILSEYKENRKEVEPELKEQIPECINILNKSGFYTLSIDRYEADDIIASIATLAKENNIFTHIYSTDKDLYQLIEDGKVELIGKNDEIINYDSCIEKFGVMPSQIVDYLALIGDSADNFKGVPGVGPAAAKKMLKEYKNLDNIYNNLNVVGTKALIAKLVDGKESAYLSQKLAKLVCDIPLDDIFTKAKVPDSNFIALLKNDFSNFEFFKLFKIANELSKEETIEETKYDIKFNSILLNNENILEVAKAAKGIVGFDTETTGLFIGAKIVGYSFSYDNNSYYVPIAHKNNQNIDFNLAKEALEILFKQHIVGHNLKFDFRIIKDNFKIELPQKYSDSMVCAWMQNPSANKFSLDYLSFILFNYECLEYTQLVKKDENFSNLSPNDAYFYACEDAYMCKMIYLKCYEMLDDGQKKALEDENKFVKVLLNIEENGIRIKEEKLKTLENILNEDLNNLTQDIYKLANKEFNIKSPKQLSTILFEDLGLENVAKGSTNEAALKKINHPIAKKILEYRTASKVLDTYVTPLLALNSLNEKEYLIRTNFLQTGTATGRLSSNNPNLQNIPARSKYASLLKDSFVAKDGYSFLSLDYSQIELRMLAHFSEDEVLLNAFLNNEDIHAKTAMQIFGEVNEKNRSFAKSINFGLIYGMGAKKLSEELNISYKDASEYISKYFDSFPKIRDYFENVKKDTKANGFIKTINGRKRYFTYTSDIKSNNANDRECINSILQGSAADLIKLAMIKMLPYLDDNKKMILQIHDELIFEVKNEEIESFSKIIINIMENAYPLKVKLKTSLSIGESWSNL